MGCLLPSIRWSEWELPASWRVLLGGWALALSLAWPVLVGREVGFDLQRFADVSNATSWAGMSAPLVTGWMMHVVLLQLVGLLWLEWILRRASAAPEGKLPLAVHGLWIGATVSSVVAVYQGTVDLTFLSSVEWAARGRATGLMLDANSFGTVAALAGPLAVVAVRSRPWRHGAAAAAAVFAVNWAGVWMSGSRTAFLLALIGTGALAVTLLRLGRPRARVLVPVAGAFLAVVVVALTFSSVTDPLVRYGSLENPNDATVADSLLNRGGYGGIAVELFRERPLTGVGAGTYHWLAVDYLRMQLDQELSFDNAQNWWRHQLAELGLAGGLAVLLWSLLVVRMVLWRGRGSMRTGAGTYRGLLLGLGLISLVGMPTENPVALLWFFTLVALLAAAGGGTGGAPELVTRLGRQVWVAVALLAVAYASGHALLAVGDLDVTARAVRASRDYAIGVYAYEPHPDGGEFRWTEGQAELVLAERTPWLVLRTWVAHPDVGAEPVTLRLATPCQIIVERTLSDASAIDLPLALPGTGDPLRLSVDVSRTWRPTDFDSPDSRELGAGLLTDFVGSLSQASEAGEPVVVTPCVAGAAP